LAARNNGQQWSLADAAATPYVWRLDKLKLARMWEERPGVLAWYDRVRSRLSFKAAVDDWLSPADIERYTYARLILGQRFRIFCRRPKLPFVEGGSP
jgi:hypothetical protein